MVALPKVNSVNEMGMTRNNKYFNHVTYAWRDANTIR